MGVGGWSKGILEFRFGTNLGLRLEARTKLNNNRISPEDKQNVTDRLTNEALNIYRLRNGLKVIIIGD